MLDFTGSRSIDPLLIRPLQEHTRWESRRRFWEVAIERLEHIASYVVVGDTIERPRTLSTVFCVVPIKGKDWLKSSVPESISKDGLYAVVGNRPCVESTFRGPG